MLAKSVFVNASILRIIIRMIYFKEFTTDTEYMYIRTIFKYQIAIHISFHPRILLLFFDVSFSSLNL